LGPLVSQFEGTLDQFSGDGIMVFFNDPVPIPHPAEPAVKMALAMRETAGTLIADRREVLRCMMLQDDIWGFVSDKGRNWHKCEVAPPMQGSGRNPPAEAYNRSTVCFDYSGKPAFRRPSSYRA
jgi:hypothetical protein